MTVKKYKDKKTRDSGNIYRLIYHHNQSSRQQIAEELNISLPTVTHNLNLLEDTGLICKDGTFQSTGGRKANLFRCIPDIRYALGIDITRNHLSIVLINLNLDIINKKRMRIPFQDTDIYYQNMQQEIEDILDKHKIDRSKMLGVGISLPVIIKKDQKTISYATVIPIAADMYERISKHMSYPYLLFNDANSAGLAESWFSDSDNPIVYLFLSSSVGGSLMMNGGIFAGINSYASEFGHMCIVPNGKKCYCGGLGHLDAYCSAKNLSDFTDGDLKLFFEEMKNGNSGFQRVFDEYLDYLAIAVNNLRMCYDCDIILGGAVGAYMTDYLEEIQKRAVALNPFRKDGSYVKSCHFKTEAAAVGAAIYYINQFIEEL